MRITTYCEEQLKNVLLAMWKHYFKILMAIILTITLSVATVVCCCIAPSVMAQFHQQVTCSHCHSPNNPKHSSNPAEKCLNQLTSADLSVSFGISHATASVTHWPTTFFVQHHRIVFLHSLIRVYPPGGPPLGLSFAPQYLHTFNLRI